MNRFSRMMPDPGYEELDVMPAPEGAGFEIDLQQVWAVIYRNRLLIAVVVAAALLAGVAVTLLSTPIYRAEASVQVEQQTSHVLASSSDTAEPIAAASETERFLQTQVDILKSESLAQRVAAALGLARDDRFLERMKVKPTGGLPPADPRRKRQLVDTLTRNLSVDLPRNSRIVTLSFTSPDPVLAARVANSYATSFIVANLQRRYDASAYARDFLQNQLGLAKQRLEESERAAIAYARQAGILDASGGMSGGSGVNGGTASGIRSLVTSDLVQLNEALIQAQAKRVAAEQRWREAAATPLLSLPEVQSNGSIQQLSQQRAALEANYQQELQRHKPDFPTMKQASAQLDALDKQISQIATHIRDGIRTEYQVAQRQEQRLASDVSGLKASTLAEQDRSVRYNILRREADTNRTMYDGLLQRYKEVSAAAGIATNNISLLDTADVPLRPIRPRPLVNLALAALLGVLLAAGIVFAREKIVDSINSPDDLTSRFGVPFLNAIPKLAKGKVPLDELDNPRSAFAEAYYALRTTLRLATADGLPRTILVTSSREAEGKSTTAYAIARSFAEIGVRVLLIDGDMRRPSLHRILGTGTRAGLSNVLARQSALDAVIEPTEVDNLAFLSSGPIPPSPAELLSGNTLAELIQHALGSFDLILIDGPPLLGLADAVIYATAVAGTLFVVESERSSYGHVKTALRRLSTSGARTLGTVLTKFDSKRSGYYGAYNYKYYQY